MPQSLILQAIWIDNRLGNQELYEMLYRCLIIFLLSLVVIAPTSAQTARKESVTTAKKRQIKNRTERPSRKIEQKKRIRKPAKKVDRQRSKIPPQTYRKSINSNRSIQTKKQSSAGYNASDKKKDENKARIIRNKNQVKQNSTIKSIKPALPRKTISKGSAVNVAKKQINGKVLSAKLINSKGPKVYRVKVLVGESRVKTVFVDGETGKIIKVNQD